MNFIIFNSRLYYFYSVFPALYIINGGLFMLQVFINLKKVTHFIKNVLRQVVYVMSMSLYSL